MKNLWRRRGVPSKSGDYFWQHALVQQDPRNESSDISSDSDDSGSSYKTSQLSPQIYNLKSSKNQKYNHFPKNYGLASSTNNVIEKDNNSIRLRVNHRDEEEEDPRNICAGINVPELVKYFDGLEICNGQILTGRTIKGKPWETSGKKNNNDHVILPHTTNDHTYSKPPKTENSGKPIVNSCSKKDDFFNDERFRNVCTSRRKRIMKKDELKKCSVVRDHHGTTVRKETPVATRLDNSDNIPTKTNVPMKKYTSIVGPMPHIYRPFIDITPNDHFTRNNDCRQHFKPGVSNNSNTFESTPKSSIMPPSIAVTRDTYFYPRDRGDQNTMEYQQKDCRMRNTCLDDQTKYQRREKNCPITDQSAGLYTRPGFHMGHKDCKNNLLIRPHTLSQNDHLLRNAGPVEDNRQGKKDQNQNLTFDITPEDCASLCLSRKGGREYQSQETEAETSTKISASKLSISQSPSHPSVLSIRIDINLSHPNLYSPGARSLDLTDRNKRKTENP